MRLPMTGKERALGDAIDWSFAAGVGVRLTRSEPAMSRYTRDAVQDELFSAAARAEGPVREHTRLDDGTEPPPAQVVDRPG
ncbi:hydrolase, partial [Rhodococcus sp. IITR03]